MDMMGRSSSFFPKHLLITNFILNMKNIFLLSFVVLLSACASVGRLERTAPMPTADETIFVIGVSPERARITVHPGALVDRVFKQNIFRSDAVYGGPNNGFVVGKAKAGDALAIMNVRMMADKDSIMGLSYKPCEGAKTLVFTAPAGKVIYVGSFTYELLQNRLQVTTAYEFEEAQKFIDANYPNLKGKLELQKYGVDLLSTTESCAGQTITIPIYIHRAK
jgi:hypothetical protein